MLLLLEPDFDIANGELEEAVPPELLFKEEMRLFEESMCP